MAFYGKVLEPLAEKTYDKFAAVEKVLHRYHEKKHYDDVLAKAIASKECIN